ncbi:MAG: 4'-phosphopantetheinyl transferase superfamily protein [Gammaproteobacteria bacterium]|nr:4'-phosphopantetheinyl transferase superfamily protein [Gammaproteobacteria bacterium]
MNTFYLNFIGPAILMHFSAATHSFLTKESNLNWWPESEAAQYSTNFSPAAYEDKLFSLLDIDLPVTLTTAVVKRKAEFLAGRYCAKRALATLGGATATVAIGENRNPIWPASTIGSISHNNTKAVALVDRNSTTFALGVDIEHKIQEQLVWKLKDQVLNKAEKKWLKHKYLAPTETFTLIFSAKESLFKALYPSVNQYFGFDAATAIAFDTNSQTIHLKLNRQLGKIWPYGTIIKVRYKKLEADILATYVRINSHELT